MNSDISANKPDPILDIKSPFEYSRASNVDEAIQTLVEGNNVLIKEFYSNGLTLLNEVEKYLLFHFPNKTFLEQREYRTAYNKLSNLILIEIVDHNLNVKKAPQIGWLKKLYPELDYFLLPFPKVQGLNSAWQWYKNGITVPVLRNKIHPYYDTYFPTRFDHLILFENWLKRYDGPKKFAYDVGIGSGILSFQLVQHGFQKVLGTDINPNAIIGLQESMGNTKLSRKIELDHASLFGKWDKQTELIVFNPPWLPATDSKSAIDDAIYYKEDMFPKFFEAAKERLLEDGKIVILFSNLAQITNVTQEHPIINEINEGGRFQVEKHLTKAVKNASNKTKRDQHWREREEVELWVLTHNGKGE